MKGVIISFLICIVYLNVQCQTVKTWTGQQTIALMKAYGGSATACHVTSTNQNYDTCVACTANEVNIFAGTGSGTGRKWKQESDSSKVDSSAVAQTASYVINKMGTTYYARPRVGSGLLLISNTDAYTVIQGAIDNLTIAGATGSGGGKIYLTKGTYSLTNELTIIGWESGGVPYSQLVIEGDGYSSQITQSTATKNGIVIKNGASVGLRNLSFSRSGSAKSCILGDSTGGTSEFSFYRAFIENVLCYGSSTSTPTVFLKNIAELAVTNMIIENTTGDAMVIDNASAGSLYGNSTFNFLGLYASPTYPYANLKIVSTQNSVWSNLMTFNNITTTHGYYGIYTDYASNCTFNFVDIEGITIPIYIGAQSGNSKGITFNSAYLYPNTGDTAISVGSGSAANSFNNIAIEAPSSTTYGIVDLSNFAIPNIYNNIIFKNSATAAKVVVTNTATKISWLTSANNGTSVTKIPGLTLPLNARLADFPTTGIVLTDSIADRLMLRTAALKTATLSLATITANTSVLDTLPNKSGTFAFTSDNDLKLNKVNFVDSLNNYPYYLLNSQSSGDSLFLPLTANKGVFKRIAEGTNFHIVKTSDSLLTLNAVADATLAGTQTFSGAKTFSADLTTSGDILTTTGGNIGSALSDFSTVHTFNIQADGADFKILGSSSGGGLKIYNSGGNIICQNSGTYTPISSAFFAINSGAGGFLMPRYTTTNKTNNISSPTEGLIVYDSTLHLFSFYNGTAWTSIGVAPTYVAKTSNYTLTASDYTVDATSGTFTATLPTAIGIAGRIYIIKNSGAGTITIATTSSQTVDATTTKTLNTQYSGYQVQSDGANWKIISSF